MRESIRKGRNRERTPWQPPPDSAPPVDTDDSEQALDHVPQSPGDRKPQRFRRTLNSGPFLRSAPHRTGTTHPVTHGRRTSTKNNKSVKENGNGCHAKFCGKGGKKKTGVGRGGRLEIAVRIFPQGGSVAPTAFEIRGNWDPSLTRWANFFRASGAGIGTSERPVSEDGPYKIACRGVKAAACATPSEFEGFEGDVLGGD